MDKNIENTDIELKNIKRKMSFIGWIGVIIGIILMVCLALIPNIPHATVLDIILYVFVFGGGGLFLLLLSS